MKIIKLLLVIQLVFSFSCSMNRDDTERNVIIYPAPENEELNTKFNVTADGYNVPVYDVRVGPETKEGRDLAMDDKANSDKYYETAGMAYFDMKKGPVTVCVTIDNPIKKAKILPTSYGISPEIKDNTLSFTVDSPKNLTIELNGEYVRSLHLFINEEEKDIPDPKDPNVVYFGPGSYRLPAMALEDGMTVYVAGGAIVRCYVGPHEWYKINNYSGLKNYDPFYMYDLTGKNITFRGRGIIDQSDIPTHSRRSVLINGENIKLEGVIFRNPSEWTVQIKESNNIHVDNIKIIGHRANSDGIDICSSQNVLVENCFIRTLDDLIVVKTLRDGSEAGHIEVKKCVLWNEVAHALSIGAEITNKVEDVLFHDCDIIHDHGREWALRVYNTDKGLVKNVRFENIRIEETVKFASLWINKAFWTSDAERGHIRDIIFKDIVLTSLAPLVKGIELLGYDKEHAIKNVTFDNVVIQGKKINNDNIVTNDYVYEVTVK